MKRVIWILLSALVFTGCTPHVGVSVPIGKYGYTGVSASEHGVHTVVGVGVGL